MTTRAASPASVLIIDDDEKLNALLTEYLGTFGFAVRAAAHPEEGLRTLRNDAADIVILDVMLPDLDGFTVCRRIRETSRVPIIMLTARGDVMDRIVGLELGADDYLPKPFEPRELVARIQAVLRRGAAPDGDEVLRVGALVVNWTTRSASLEDKDPAAHRRGVRVARSPRPQPRPSPQPRPDHDRDARHRLGGVRPLD